MKFSVDNISLGILSVILLFLVGCSSVRFHEPMPKKTDPLFLSKSLAGWVRNLDRPVERFVSDNLWEKLDGGAYQILELGFSELVVAWYIHPETKREIEVVVYMMKTPESAARLFEMFIPDSGTEGTICGRSYAYGNYLSFQRGPIYVQIIAQYFDDSCPRSLDEIGRAMCALITDNSNAAVTDADK